MSAICRRQLVERVEEYQKRFLLRGTRQEPLQVLYERRQLSGDVLDRLAVVDGDLATQTRQQRDDTRAVWRRAEEPQHHDGRTLGGQPRHRLRMKT